MTPDKMTVLGGSDAQSVADALKLVGDHAVARAAARKPTEKPAKASTKKTKTPTRRKKPVGKKPVGKKPVDDKPVDTSPVDQGPVDPKPVDPQPVDPKPVDTKPVKDDGKKPVVKVKVTANDHIAMIAMRLTKRVDKFMGFAIFRREVLADGTIGPRQVLMSQMGWQDNDKWEPRPTTEWPIQKMGIWRDYAAEFGKRYVYDVVPMVGEPGKLTAVEELAAQSNPVVLTTQVTKWMKIATTLGILSLQKIAHMLPKDEAERGKFIVNAINTPGSELRKLLSSVHVIDMSLELLRRAKAERGHVFQAFYELSDPEVKAEMKASLGFFSLILSNTGADDKTNAEFRAELHKLRADVIDRMLGESSIGHNKLEVYVDANGVPRAVSGGSTNRTATGFCTQANHLWIIESDELAKAEMDHWNQLKADTLGGLKGELLQSASYRAWNAAHRTSVKIGDTEIISWHSPNTELREKPKTGAPVPPDMGELFDLMDNADALFFLEFFPGAPSVVTKIAQLSKKKTGKRPRVIRGAVSSVQAMLGETHLYHRPGTPPIMIAAGGLEKQIGSWLPIEGKLPDAHAIIHTKLVVGNPFDPVNCWVAMDSHNQGFKPSYQNDDRLIIIKGNQAIALFYLVHCMDVYDHYKFLSVQNSGHGTFTGRLAANDNWQDKYLNDADRAAEVAMWTDYELPLAA